jgi:hypothetical protein
MVNDLLQGLQLLAVVIVAREVDLVLSKFVTTVIRDETFGINEPEAASCLIFGQAFLDEELDNLLRDTDTGTTGTEEDGTVVSRVDTSSLDGVNDTSQNNGTSSLDIIVEAGIFILITVQSWERILPVLKLNDNSIQKFLLVMLIRIFLQIN